VHVVTTLDKGMLPNEIRENFHIHRISVPNFPQIKTISFWLKSTLIINEISPDIVHAQGIGVGVVGLFVKNISRKPYVVWCQGSDVYTSWKFKKLITKLVLYNSAALISLTLDMSKEIRRLYDIDSYIIPNGIELKKIKRTSEASNIQSKKGFIVLFVGTLRPIKGVKYLIESMKIIIQSNTEVKLYILGDGEEREKLELLCKQLELSSAIYFKGKVSNAEAIDYMRSADILVLPSLSEGFPLVLLEAMASGLPVVSTRIRGIPEIVVENENGFLVEPANTEELAQKILLLLNDKNIRNKIMLNNIMKAEDYSWDLVVKKLEEVYKKAITNMVTL
jgi:glycosyltransferase involved in cell wall biosynthesis